MKRRGTAYARKTLPDGLRLDTSLIPDAGIGVFTLNDISEGVRYGPYLGEIELDYDKAFNSGYAWMVSDMLV